ncbi:MAG TPA: ChaN family lipoprotein [Bacteroidales bacterium]|nr:ChaN family lipoprotein [Bacteroidales bacterium]
MKKILLLLLLFVAGNHIVTARPAYRIFDAVGDSISYQQMLEQLLTKDLVFFGELHNNPIAHWLQLELTRDMHTASDRTLVLGAEMFETDDQIIVDEYLKGYYKENNFREEAKLWNNYKTDYRPLLEFAREKELEFVATNIPRRYASMVSRGGFEALEKLSDRAKEYIAPLPIPYDPNLPGYQKMLRMAHMPGRMENKENLPKAQAIKDATMAHFILENRDEESFFLHYNGTYHSNNHEGIVWYIRKYAPGTNVGTIATVEQSQLDQLSEDHQGLADFILVVDEDMTDS